MKKYCCMALFTLLLLVGCGAVERERVEEERDEVVFRDDRYRPESLEEDVVELGEEELDRVLQHVLDEDVLREAFGRGVMITKTYSDSRSSECFIISGNEFYWQSSYKSKWSNRNVNASIFQDAQGQVHLREGAGQWQHDELVRDLVVVEDLELVQLDVHEVRQLQRVERDGAQLVVLDVLVGEGEHVLAHVDLRSLMLKSLVYRDGDTDITLKFQSLNKMPDMNLDDSRSVESLSYNNAAFLLEELQQGVVVLAVLDVPEEVQEEE